MIRRLARYLDPEDAVLISRYFRWTIVSSILQGVTLAFIIPVLRAVLTGDTTATAGWLVGFCIAAVVSWRVEYLATLKGFDTAGELLTTLRYRIGDHVAALPLGWFTPANTSTLGLTLSKGVMDILALPARQLTALIKSIVIPLVLIAVLLGVDHRIGLIALAAVPAVGALYWWVGRLGRRADAAVNRATADASDRMVEFAQAQPVLRTFGRAGSATDHFDRALQEQARTERRHLWLVLPPVILNGMVVRLTLLGLLSTVIAFAAGVTDALALATLLATLPIINRLVTPLGEVAGHATVIRVAAAQMDAVDQILDAEPLPEPAMPRRPSDATIAFENVSFAYDTGTPVLSDISFTVPQGSTTAIVGPSGSGKSTIIRLAARFFDPQNGEIRIGSTPLPLIGAENLHHMVAPVFQDNYLFSGTLADNVRIARPDATDADLDAVARHAGLAEVVTALPEGWNSHVGEGGTRLSGGERQRVAIARAFLKDAPILLLDEATGSLDAENQQALATAIDGLRRHKTVIVIAHQLTTITTADEILFLEGGRIVERGTHQELLTINQRYASHWRALNAARTWRLLEQ
ncbi:ABC transporter ATP-binding protein [Actinomadura rudentiformis]|uniref:ABC transporter ATP-binding protein n=1 Tax=Actinomadura rudentiformis TaxID=359158 RepID=A0A6H9YUS6_9ACTN|nr:ABC transporter ATP-binding protein [Actinomadura rudentiformis]KAB2352281.1 ABC transporter ATP-binding protein [Actinomadura rudentiformis]